MHYFCFNYFHVEFNLVMSKNSLTTFLAIDLGATSGRSILGTIQNDTLVLEEISRFPNPIIEVNGRLYWDLFYLYNEILHSLKKVKSKQGSIESIGIDTWGVDFVSIGNDGMPLRMPLSYRDHHTLDAPEKYFSILPREEVYLKTGIQIMNFNSLFQLATLREDSPSLYSLTDKILFMPDALSYLMTGKMVTEYTIASTSQMINPYDKQFDNDLLSSVGLTADHFAPIVFPGEVIGRLSESVCRQTAMESIPVIAVAGHDTASAVLATPAEGIHFAYLSSGTWSLMGIEALEPVITDETFAMNFTNEGGADGTIRLLKNICGMWLIEQCRKEWQETAPLSYEEIVHAAENASSFKCFINPDSSRFAAPQSMTEAIQSYCRETGQFVPSTTGEIARCIYESLAFRYRQVLENLQKLAGFPIDTLHIIGGGSLNRLLNTYTANAIGKPVIAGPSEATAIGNILMQAKAHGLVRDKQEMRRIVANSFQPEQFLPAKTAEWNAHYSEYLQIFREN